MRKELVSLVHAGEVLARPVISEKGVVLLYEGARLNDESISKLIANNISEVYLSETYDDTTSYTVESLQQDALKTVEDIVTKKIQGVEGEESELMTKVVTDLINEVVNDPRLSSHLLNVKRFHNDIYSHCMGVAAMSVIIGLRMKMSMSQLRDIAVGALLHDIGLNGVEMNYLNVEVSCLPAKEKLMFRNHVIHGYERLKNESWISDVAKAIVLSHHERMDGTGYPFHTLGQRIPQEVRLVSICDYFDELTNGIGYEQRKIYEVVETLRTAGTTAYDYDMLMTVITNVAWYPTGALVRTNENELARVIRQNSGLPDRPILQVVLNADGTPPATETIKDLLECLTIFIEETIEE